MSLTPDVLPYRGYGVSSKGEYDRQMHLLRKIADARVHGVQGLSSWPLADERDDELTTDAWMAISRGGLVRQLPDGFYKLTDYGQIYLHQRDPKYPKIRSSR